MTKLEYMRDRLASVYFDLGTYQHPETMREIAKSLHNMATEIEKHLAPSICAQAALMRTAKSKDDGGDAVVNPVTAPVMPPQSGVTDPISKIREMARAH